MTPNQIAKMSIEDFADKDLSQKEWYALVMLQEIAYQLAKMNEGNGVNLE